MCNGGGGCIELRDAEPAGLYTNTHERHSQPRRKELLTSTKSRSGSWFGNLCFFASISHELVVRSSYWQLISAADVRRPISGLSVCAVLYSICLLSSMFSCCRREFSSSSSRTRCGGDGIEDMSSELRVSADCNLVTVCSS